MVSYKGALDIVAASRTSAETVRQRRGWSVQGDESPTAGEWSGDGEAFDRLTGEPRDELEVLVEVEDRELG